MPDRILSLRDLCTVTSFKKSNIYNLLRNQEDPFPRPVQLSAGRVGWIESEVTEWIQSRRRVEYGSVK